jgi:CubicO group peptidase (beta-lactamase class C family)
MSEMRGIRLAFLPAACIAGFLLSPFAAPCGYSAGASPEAARAADADRFEPVRELITDWMASTCTPAVAVAVAQDGQIVWEEAFGWADQERQIPATVDTMFPLASVSKPMTATGMMVLVERGQLDLKAPVNNYLAQDGQMTVWIGSPKQVTLQRVANHTSGLARHEHFYWNDAISTMPSMDEAIHRYGNIVTLPGERYRYSNFGFGILGHVVGRVSGAGFAGFMRSDVFLPLGMTHSSVDVPPELSEYAAVEYSGGVPLDPNSNDHAGASSVWSSVHDLVRFGMFHIGQPEPGHQAILSAASIAEMQVPTASQTYIKPSKVNPRTHPCYGIGWVIEEEPDGSARYVCHYGGMGGSASELLLLPDQHIAIAAVSNQFGGIPGGFDNTLLGILIPGYSAKSGERLKQLRDSCEPKPAAQTFMVDKKLLGTWEGQIRSYDGDFPIRLSFQYPDVVQAWVDGNGPLPVNAFGTGITGSTAKLTPASTR